MLHRNAEDHEPHDKIDKAAHRYAQHTFAAHRVEDRRFDGRALEALDRAGRIVGDHGVDGKYQDYREQRPAAGAARGHEQQEPEGEAGDHGIKRSGEIPPFVHHAAPVVGKEGAGDQGQQGQKVIPPSRRSVRI